MDEIIASFEDGYKPLLAQLPKELWPQSKQHGQHSYTVRLDGGAVMEVLLRQRAFKPKVAKGGGAPNVGATKSRLGLK